MQPAITLSFATQADLEAWLAKEMARRAGHDDRAVGFALADIARRLDLLESTATKVVETNCQLHQRVKALEEEGLVTDWDGEGDEADRCVIEIAPGTHVIDIIDVRCGIKGGA